jgi:hypothetical protein
VSTSDSARDARLRPVADLLAEYLRTSPSVHQPGADGVLVEDVLAEYEQLAARGQVPSEVELCQRHPDMAGRFAAFFHLQHPPDAG